MNDFHIHKVECQHPFGDGIHVLVPPNREIFWILMHSSGLADQLHADANTLRALVKDSSKAASKVAIYQTLIPSDSGDEQYVVVNILVTPDDQYKYRGLFIMIEEHKLTEGHMVLKMMPEVMRKWYGETI